MHTGRTAVRSSDDGSLGFHTNQKKKVASYFRSIRHVRQTLQGDERAKHVATSKTHEICRRTSPI